MSLLFGRRPLLAGSLALVVPALHPALADDPAQGFVRQFTGSLAALANAGGPPAEVAALVDRAVDVPVIARFCLGRGWAAGTPDQQQRYVQAFRGWLVAKGAGWLRRSRGMAFAVGASRAEGNAWLVAATMTRPGDPPRAVEWRVHSPGGTFRVEDATVDDVSMLQTGRADVTATLLNGGGDFDRLIQALVEAARAG